MAAQVMKDLAQELESRSISLPSDTGILNQCVNALRRSGASVGDVASSLEAALLNANSDVVTEAVMTQVLRDLSKHQAKRTVGKSVTHKVGTPVRMYTKENAQRLPGFGNSSSFESVFKAKIGPVGSTPGSGSPAPRSRSVVPPSSGSPAGRGTGHVKRKATSAPIASPPSASKARRMRSGASPLASPQGSLAGSPAGQGAAYAARTNAGNVEASLHGAMKGPSEAPSPEVVNVETLPSALDNNLKEAYPFMLTRLDTRSDALEQRILDMEAAIREANPKMPEVTPVGVASQSSVVVVGRICPEDGGRLTRGSVLLEGSRRTSNSARVMVDLRDLPSYSLFPGQVVAIAGMCTTGTRLVAQRIVEGAFPKVLRAKPAALRSARTLRMWTAAGPFTLASDLGLKPLRDLFLEAIAAEPVPDVICLLGPFVDARHPEFAPSAGNQYTFDEYYQLVLEFLERELTKPELANTHVVLLPSQHDAHELPVFPQPPMKLSNTVEGRLHSMPNPAMFTVNGVVFGASTTDFLHHVSATGIFRHPPPAPHMFARLSQAMIRQRSFYPLYPAAPGTPLEISKYNNCTFPVVPDVLLVPSRLAYFAKLVNNIVVVNSGSLAKGNSAGTYAKVTVFPMPRSRLDAAEKIMARDVAAAKARAEAATDAAAGAAPGAGAGAAGAGAGPKDTSSLQVAEDPTSPAAGVLPFVGQRTRVEVVRI